jgi:hypothetical protein
VASPLSSKATLLCNIGRAADLTELGGAARSRLLFVKGFADIAGKGSAREAATVKLYVGQSR